MSMDSFLGATGCLRENAKSACAPPIKQGHTVIRCERLRTSNQTLYHVPSSILKPTGNLVVLEEVGPRSSGALFHTLGDLDGVEIVALRKHL